MCVESCPKECFYKPFKRTERGLYRIRIKLASRKKGSVIQRTSKNVTVTLGTDDSNYSRKEKLAVLLLTRFNFNDDCKGIKL